MRARTRRLASLMAALGIALTGATGCQTWFGGMTLPERALPATLPAVLRAGPASPPAARTCQPGRPRRRGAPRGRLRRRAAAGRSGSARAGRPGGLDCPPATDDSSRKPVEAGFAFSRNYRESREPGFAVSLPILTAPEVALIRDLSRRYCPGSDG